MPSLSSRATSSSSNSTLGHQWELLALLEIDRTDMCVGWAHSKNRPCHNSINKANKAIFRSLIAQISSQPLDADLLQPELNQLARAGLCRAVHQNQKQTIVQKWTDRINIAAAIDAELEVTETRSSTASFVTGRSSRTPTSRSSGRPQSVATPSTPSSPARFETDTVQRNLERLYEQIQSEQNHIQRLQTPATPRIEAGRSLARISTAAISSLHLSTNSSAAASRSASPTASSRSASPARSVPSQSSSSSPHSGSSAPSSPLVRASRRPRSTHGAIATTTTIPSSTEASVSHSVPLCTRPHVRRLPISDECPICYSSEPLSSQPASELTWCTSCCGQTMHASCFETWRTQCLTTNRTPDCPVCRANWTQSCACGGRSSCTTAHAPRRPRTSPCPVCREDMRDTEEKDLEWCKDGCGQNVHKECSEAWKAHCVANGRETSCTMCRAEWTSECSC